MLLDNWMETQFSIRFDKMVQFQLLNLEKCYIHNIFTILSQQFISGKLLQVVISRQKSNFCDRVKLEPTTYHL